MIAFLLTATFHAVQPVTRQQAYVLPCWGLSLLLLLPGCRTVETSLPAQEIRIILRGHLANVEIVALHPGHRVRLEEASRPREYRITMARMDGGYSQFAVLRYNVHDPLQYKVIAVRRERTTLRELSLEDIRALPVSGGRFLLAVPK